MKKRNILLLSALTAGVLFLAGCAGQQETAGKAAAQTEEKETSAGEDAVAGGKEILVVSFGTSYNENRDLTIGAIEDAIADAFPEYEVRRAFTSQIIIDKLKERDGLKIDNVGEALSRAAADGMKTLVVQPTHLMDGYEYTDLAEELKDYEEKFESVVLAEPLLSSEEDFDAVAAAITEHTAAYDDGETAICFMGHGTEADSNRIYPKLQEEVTADGFDHYFIGTVEAEPTLEDVVEAVKEKGIYQKVVLVPLMVVAGDHANNDMAGEEEDSWKSVFQAEGFEVECLIEGLGQNEAIRQIYVEHARAAIESLAE